MATDRAAEGLTTKSSNDIDVREFRQIIFWPLVLSGRTLGDTVPRQVIASLLDRIDGASTRLLDQGGQRVGTWKKVADPILHIARRAKRIGMPEDSVISVEQAAYQEYIYFHNFVQRFLYDQGDSQKPVAHISSRLFTCNGINSVTIEIGGNEHFRITLDVERLNLYLFDAGIAILSLQVGSQTAPIVQSDGGAVRAMRLADALDLTDHFRRCFPPFWFTDAEGNEHAGLFPLGVGWGSGPVRSAPRSGEVLPKLPLKSLSAASARIHPRYEPIVDWWSELLPDAIVLEGPKSSKDGQVPSVLWQHVVDERLPTMTYVAVDDPREINRGDWQRLCFADASGYDDTKPPDPQPYAKRFLENFEQEHCYDRFWYVDPADAATAEPVRFLFCGYHFAAVGRATTIGNAAKPSFFRRHVADHFERHYYQMGLVCHFQHAALLSFSDRISDAVSSIDPDKNPRAFRSRIKAIERDRLRFTHTYWFSGISTQMQAKEMYDRWREQLGVAKLYAEVSDEAKSASSWLEAQAQGDSTQSSETLAKLAAGAAALGLPMAFFGMNILVKPLCEADKGSWICWSDWWLYGATTAAVSSVVCLLFLWLQRPRRR